MAKSSNKRMIRIETLIARGEKRVKKPSYIKYNEIEKESDLKIMEDLRKKIFDKPQDK